MTSTRNRLFGLVAGVAGLAVALSGTAAAAVPLVGGGDAVTAVNEPLGAYLVTESKSSVLSVPGAGSAVERYFPETVTYREQITSRPDFRFDFQLDTMPTGNGTYVSAVFLHQSDGSDYRAKVVVQADGRVAVSIVKQIKGAETVISPPTLVKGLVYDKSLPSLSVRVTAASERSGVNTMVAVMDVTVWKTGAQEPASSSLSGWESGSLLTGAGTVGVVAYASSAATNVPVDVTVENLTVRTDGENYVDDRFFRTMSSGWGTPEGPVEFGDTWTTSRGLSTDKDDQPLPGWGESGVGSMTFTAAGQTRSAELASMAVRDVVVRTNFALDRIPDGRGVYVSVFARKTSAGSYQSKLVISEGKACLYIIKTVGGVDTYLAQAVLPASFVVDEDVWDLSIIAKGSGGQTTLTAYAAPRFSDFPDSRSTLTATDSSPELQGYGVVGVVGYVSTSATSPEAKMNFGEVFVGRK